MHEVERIGVSHLNKAQITSDLPPRKPTSPDGWVLSVEAWQIAPLLCFREVQQRVKPYILFHALKVRVDVIEHPNSCQNMSINIH